MSSTHRLQILDAFRGIAALLVVLFHLVGALTAADFDAVSQFFIKLFSFGYIGVDLFFIISGFVICVSLDRQPPSLLGFRGFMRARFIRLTPPYWALIAYVAIEHVLDGRISGSQDYWQVITNLFYLQNLTGHGDLVPVFWTLCYEMQFYLLFGFLYLVVARSSDPNAERYFQGFLFICALISLYAFFLDRKLFWDGFMFTYFHFFAIGIFLNWTLQGRAHPAYFYSLGLAFIGFYGLGDRHAIRLIGLGFAVFLFVVIRCQFELKWLRSRAMLHLGLLSYSLYLAHPVFGWKAIMNTKEWFATSDFASFSALLLLGLAGSYLAAYVLYRIAEKPAIAWSKSSGKATAAVATAPT